MGIRTQERMISQPILSPLWHAGFCETGFFSLENFYLSSYCMGHIDLMSEPWTKPRQTPALWASALTSTDNRDWL